MGIEPTPLAWKAKVLPLNYTRAARPTPIAPLILVEGGGFEPPKAEPSDLQSDPFGHSGTPPKEHAILRQRPWSVNPFFSRIPYLYLQTDRPIRKRIIFTTHSILWIDVILADGNRKGL